ncbi:MAG TPA: aspartate carbamoyltransferase catalytic subunit [Polyangiaceae bacterium]|jgi:aspartate carbamoyltransferase catalytic subunit|nr:aspartate carbamoyltransferase catalytic subunit [Polyangiaceae bacterium]
MTLLQRLTSINDLTRDEAVELIDSADAFFELSLRPVRKAPTLRGKTVLNLFFENSTRTRTSFELAGKRLSADVINITGSASSVKKGESLKDTILTLDAMHPDILIVRHSSSGAADYVARHTRAVVINAGDGTHEHPTQALLDAFTIRRHKKRLAGLKVAICGDITHSRVARSNALLLSLLGAEVHLAGPRTLLPEDLTALGCPCYERVEPAIEGADVVMMLRIQTERLSGIYFPGLREYSRYFSLTSARLALAKPDAIVMHPGPMNRGVEIADEVADGPQSVILDQVEAGVAVRMAILYACARPDAEPS